MISKISILSFKSIENVTIELSNINVFIGANGSGKSNLLEAIGVLSAAADGKVNDQTLLNRGIRASNPRRYKSAFISTSNKTKLDMSFSGYSSDCEYHASFLNPTNILNKGWIFKTEKLGHPGSILFQRDAVKDFNSLNPENGLAALKMAELSKNHAASTLIKRLQEYAIYSPNTPVLRGTTPETQPRMPLGLSGGQLGEAFREMVSLHGSKEKLKLITNSLPYLIGWAKLVGWEEPPTAPLYSQTGSNHQHPPNVISSPAILSFQDRFMTEDRNILSGYEVSEGALYVIFMAVIAGHPSSPNFFAIDNADHVLNPGLAKNLFRQFSEWILDDEDEKQILITCHNPAVLDGLPFQNDRVRLFAVDRDNFGKTIVKRIELDSKLRKMADQGWTLSRLWMNKYIGGMPDV